MQAKYVLGALILYVLMAGVVVAIHPSGSENEIATDALLWPFSALGYLWDRAADFYGPIFG